MAYKTRRQQRYTMLRSKGFLPFEAQTLSKIPVKSTPYIRELIVDRNKMYLNAKDKKTTTGTWEKQIKELYSTSGFRTNKRGKIVADVWKMVRYFEDRYKDKYPEYTSPWKKRLKTWRDFMSKAEKTIEKQNK